MAIIPLSLERHRELRWSPFSHYGFARTTAVAPLVLAELPRAVLSLPVGFLRGNGAVQPAALLGLKPEENLFVAPDGRWLGPYVPAVFRGYPFRLLPIEADNRMALCVDEESGLIGPDESEAFFGPDGQPTERVRHILDFLSQVEASRQAAIAAAAALDAAGLLVPWSIEIREEGATRRVEGLLRVDESALNQLTGEALARLRSANALSLAYLSLLSMQHLQSLGGLARLRILEAQKMQSVFETAFSDGHARQDIVFDWDAAAKTSPN